VAAYAISGAAASMAYHGKAWRGGNVAANGHLMYGSGNNVFSNQP